MHAMPMTNDIIVKMAFIFILETVVLLSLKNATHRISQHGIEQKRAIKATTSINVKLSDVKLKTPLISTS
jgi:hypothetical protein